MNENCITARFQRNSDGQYVGRMMIEGEETECWLVFESPEHGAVFLELTFIDPYRKPDHE